MIKSLSQSTHALFSVSCSVFAIGMGALCQFASAVPAEVYINQLVQEYDGNPKFPGIATDPPGLAVDVSIAPRSQSEVVFQTIPSVPEPSYGSFGLEALVNLGNDKALGEEVDLGGTNRFLESVDVAMVNFAKASDWPTLAGENPAGYLHPLTIIVYKVVGGDLTLVSQKTQQTLIPWRPAALDDGSEYPYGGIGFNVRFDFNEDLELSGRIAVLVAYNTESAGFEPIGQPGPYNVLNVAMANNTPLVGSDVDETRMLRFITGVSKSRAFNPDGPIFTIRAFPAAPSPGTPLDAGGYRVTATISEVGFEGSSRANLKVTPLEADVFLSGMRQVSDGTPKSVTVTTTPAALSSDVVYARRSGPPVDRGLYPVFVSLSPGNYTGKVSGTMRLGYSFASWIAEKVAAGDVAPGLDGKEDDPDLDGRTNFVEYLSLTNPGVANGGSPSLLKVTGDTAEAKIQFLRNNEATDVEYQLQVTDDLSDPASWSNLPIAAEGTAPFLTAEQVEVFSPLSPLVPSEFFRLKISTP